MMTSAKIFLVFSSIALLLEWILLTTMNTSGNARRVKTKNIIKKIFVFTFITINVLLIVLCAGAAFNSFKSGLLSTAKRLIITTLLLLISLCVLISD